MNQSIVTPPYKRCARSFFLALCLLQSASYAYASEDLITIEQRAGQGNTAALSALGFSYCQGKGLAQDDKAESHQGGKSK